MVEQEGMEGTPEAEETAGPEGLPAEEREPQAGIRELAAALFILVVVVGGLVYAWFQGYDTGYLDGQDESRRIELESVRRAPPGIQPSRQVLLTEGQELRMTLEGPDGKTESITLDAGEGDLVVVSIGKRGRGAPAAGGE